MKIWKCGSTGKSTNKVITEKWQELVDIHLKKELHKLSSVQNQHIWAEVIE